MDQRILKLLLLKVGFYSLDQHGQYSNSIKVMHTYAYSNAMYRGIAKRLNSKTACRLFSVLYNSFLMQHNKV